MANSTDVAEFEMSKENILPIQQGRKANVLKSALTVQPEENLLQQRRVYEQQLRLYSGDDPLSIWYSYIKWVEQNYPKGGRDGNICRLIQQCLLNLKDEVKYHNDDRFIDTWIKFANLSNKPNEVYSNMYSRSIGCSSSKFYVAWAWEVEQSGDIKRAFEILQEGLNRNAQPKDYLKSAHTEVQMRLVKSFNSDDCTKECDILESDHRSAFTRLKSKAKNKAPVSRVGDAVISTTNPPIINQQKTSLKSSQTRIPFKIYSAENEMPSLPVQNHKGSDLSMHWSTTKENERKLSKWSKVKVQQASHGLSKGLQFTVHYDDTPQPESSKKLPQSTKVLTTHSDPWKPAIALFEDQDSMIRPMYDKAKVYGGGEEFSFEEIRAAKWYEYQKQLEKERRLLQEEKEKDELKKQVKQLQEKMQYLETLAAPVLQKNIKSSIMSKDLNNGIQSQFDDTNKDLFDLSKPCDVSAYMSPPKSEAIPSHEKLNEPSDNDKNFEANHQNFFFANNCGIERNKENEIFEEVLTTKDKSISMEVKQNQNMGHKLVSPTSIPVINKKIEEPIIHRSNMSPELPVTVTKRLGNTYIAKEVNSMMQELYNGTTGNYAELDDLSFNINLTKPDYRFDFDGLDRNDTEFVDIKLSQNKKFSNLDCENKFDEKKLRDFSIYRDPTEIIPSKPMTSFHIFQDDKSELDDENRTQGQMQCDFVHSHIHKTGDYDNASNKNFESSSHAKNDKFEEIENIPPPDYIQSTEKRELSGILQLSKNIQFIPLEDQLREEEEEELEVDDNLDDVRPFDNLTLLTAEQFSAAACSTPCIKPQPISTRESQAVEVQKRYPTISKEMEPSHEKSSSTIYKILNEAVNLADSEEVRQLLIKILLDVTKRKCADVLKELSFNIIERLELGCNITNNGNLKLLLQNCIKVIEINNEKVKDFNQSHVMPHDHAQQLSTIMETSRENKSSSSSSLSSTKQKSIYNSHLSTISKLKTPMAEICEKSEASEIYDENPETVSKQNISCINDDIDPFDPELTSKFLKILKVPVHERDNFYNCKDYNFKINPGSYFKLGKTEYLVNSLHAEGAYAKVYSAQYAGNSFIDIDQTFFIPMSKLAIKVCKGANNWEFYICSELRKRLEERNVVPNISESVMEIKSAAAYENCLVIISDFFEYGTLLNIVNSFKLQNSRIPEYLVMFFALEMLHIVSGLHKCGIVHGDIKPDNFMLNEIPNSIDIDLLLSEPKCLRLIDFGRAIDLSLFKPGITFPVVVKTDGFQCVQMRENRPWVFESDWYGVLACIHVLLFSEYMDVRKNANNEWEPVQKFKRYFQADIWEPLFHTLLNIQSCYAIPDLTPFTTMLTERLRKQSKAFKMQLVQLKLAFSKIKSNIK